MECGAECVWVKGVEVVSQVSSSGWMVIVRMWLIRSGHRVDSYVFGGEIKKKKAYVHVATSENMLLKRKYFKLPFISWSGFSQVAQRALHLFWTHPCSRFAIDSRIPGKLLKVVCKDFNTEEDMEEVSSTLRKIIALSSTCSNLEVVSGTTQRTQAGKLRTERRHKNIKLQTVEKKKLHRPRLSC